jgi:hypothetical protein
VPEGQRRRGPVRVVRVRFEPSRLAAACLADAYEQVVPLVQRRTSSRGIRTKTTRSDLHRSEGGTSQ